MATRTTTRNYTGRRADLEIFQTEAPMAEYCQLSLTMTRDNVHRKVAGMQKLVQRYLLTFFTPMGTVKYRPDYGSIFMSAVNSGLLQSRSAIVQYFTFADSQVAGQLRMEDASVAGLTTPDDEKFAKSYLVDYAVDQSKSVLYLKVNLENLAGAGYVFVLPVA